MTLKVNCVTDSKGWGWSFNCIDTPAQLFLISIFQNTESCSISAMTVTNDLTSAPIPSLIRGIAIPASTGAVFNTLYNIVDSWFAGFISTQALAALGLSFPVFFCIMAMGMGIATGSTAILSNALGEKKQEDKEEREKIPIDDDTLESVDDDIPEVIEY